LKPLGRENNDIENKLSEEKTYVQTKILRGDVRSYHRFINDFQSNGAGAGVRDESGRRQQSRFRRGFAEERGH